MYEEMNQQTLAAIWKSVLEQVQDAVSEPVYRTWFCQLELIAYVNGQAFLKARGEIEKNVVEHQYVEVITSALKKIFGYDVKTVILTAEEWNTVQNKRTDSTEILMCQPIKNNREKSINIPYRNNNLNPEYSFENFVIGSHNRYAYAACQGVTTNIISGKKTRLYNPLFLYGNVGLGKTHLMHAIGNAVQQHMPEAKILYLSSETFTNDLINSIRNNKNEAFRKKYRHVDVLLIDDIQFISNKEGTQEEFFHTFNALNDANKQIVITSDRPPKEIPKLEERLRSRFSMGVIADIQPPDFETRIAILRKKAEKENVEVPNEVFEYIAEHVTNNVRELDGALLNVLTYARLGNCAISIENTKQCLKNIVADEANVQITGEHIMHAVAEFYQIKVEELQSKRRTKSVVLPRQVAMYLCREMIELSFPRIGELFGGRDHSTVLHGYEKIVEDLKYDVTLQMAVESIKRKL